MNKIPTIFLRDLDDMARVTREPNPACAWVFDGEGTATRKYDGTCVMLNEDGWWARREVKPGARHEPPDFWEISTDPLTGKRMGWEPIEQSAFAKYFDQALNHPRNRVWREGTYELCGPKVNGNPEDFTRHILIAHADAERFSAPRDYDGLAHWLTERDPTFEGIVWHHPDGRMSKIKRKDFHAAATPATEKTGA